MKHTKAEVLAKLRTDAATISDWKKSRKSLNDDDFEKYIESVFENSSDSDIESLMELKYAYSYRQEGIEKPKYIYTADEVAKKSISHQYGVDSLDMCIQREDGMFFDAGYDGHYFLNSTP